MLRRICTHSENRYLTKDQEEQPYVFIKFMTKKL